MCKEQLVYFWSWENAIHQIYECNEITSSMFIKVIMKMLSLGSADSFKLNVTFNQWQQNQLCHHQAL